MVLVVVCAFTLCFVIGTTIHVWLPIAKTSVLSISLISTTNP
jgi:hypothetical protein